MKLTGKKGVAILTAVILAASGSTSVVAATKVRNAFCPNYNGDLNIVSSVILEKPDGDVEQEIANNFMKDCPGVKIHFQGVAANDLYTKLSAMAIGNNMPDMFATDPVFAPKAISLGIPDDLGKLLGGDFINGFAKEPLQEATFNGKIVFAPWFMIPTAILYRTDIFKAAGLKPPTTFKDFISVCKALTKDTNGDGKIDQYGWAMVGTDNGSGQSRFNVIARNMGAVDLGESRPGFWEAGQNTDAWKAALQLYKDAVAAGCVPPGQFQTGYPEASVQLAQGQAAMMITGPHSIGVILNNNPALVGKLAGAPIPSAAGVQPTTNLSQQGYAIAKASKHKAAAVAYMKYLLSKKWQLRFNAVTYRLPTRLDAQADPQVNSEMSAGFVKAGQGKIFSNPQVSFYGSIAVLSSQAYQAAIKGDKSIDAIALDTYNKAMKIINDN